jgi:hypothetical protein
MRFQPLNVKSPPTTPMPKETTSSVPTPITKPSPAIKPLPSTLPTPSTRHPLNIPDTIPEHADPPSPTPGERSRSSLSPSDQLFIEMSSEKPNPPIDDDNVSELSELSELPESIPGSFDEAEIPVGEWVCSSG